MKASLLEEQGSLVEEAKRMIESAESEARDFSPVEQKKYSSTMQKIESIDKRVKRLDDLAEMTGQPQRHSQPTPIAPQNVDSFADSGPDGGEEWFDQRNQRAVRVLSRADKFAKRSAEEIGWCAHPLGRMVRYMCTGDPSLISGTRTLLESVNWAGGISVPHEISDLYVDKLRARMVMQRLGARTVPMGSETMTIVRLTGDPTIGIKAEDSAFSPTALTFDGINMTAITVGALVELSRELAEDAANIEQRVEDALAKALAQQIDYWALRGTGSAEFLGLANMSGINEVSSVGSLNYDDLISGAKLIWDDDDQPNGWVASPANHETLAKLKTGDAVNAAAMYLTPPSVVTELQAEKTSAMPDATIVMGNFARFLFGLRSPVMIEATTDGGDNMFGRHSISVKITTRISMAVEHLGSFARLTGIS